MPSHSPSNYHAYNDYKKYKEEKININPITSLSRPSFNQTGKFGSNTIKKQYSLQSNRVKEKQHIQTFGNDQKYQINQTKYESKYLNYQSKLLGKYGKPQQNTNNYQSQYLKNKYSPDTKAIQSDYRGKNYEKERTVKAYKPSIASYLGKQDPFQFRKSLQQKDQSTLTNQLPNSSFQASEDLEDQIIYRSRNVEGLNNKVYDENSYKISENRAYNYSKKIGRSYEEDNSFDNYAKQDRKQISDNIYQPRNILLNRQVQKVQKDDTQLLKVSPYRNRNQLIKQRLQIDQNKPLQQTGRIHRKSKPQHDQIKFQSKEIYDYNSKYRTTNVTPQKNPYTPRDQKHTSEQRRKSLIQKSQILKEKLNRMGASSTKNVQNEQNQSCSIKNNQQPMSSNYTPKRYVSSSFPGNSQIIENSNLNVSKRLSFDQSLKERQFEKQNNRYLQQKQKQAGYNTLRQETKQAGRSSLKQQMKSSPYQYGKSSQHYQSGYSPQQMPNQDPIKKISQLNEKINNRLQSILKNYA